MNAKEILLKVKALFEAPVIAPTPIEAPGAAAVAPVATPFKLQDGTDITIGIDDPTVSMLPDAGDMVTIAGAPAPAGDYTLDDGTVLTVDATGVITLAVMPQPVTQPAFTAPVAKTLEERISAIESKINLPTTMSAISSVGDLTTEKVQEMYAKFATGSTDERIANLEVMIKALMDNSFGYQIRQGQENEAIAAYKNSLTPMQTAMESQKGELGEAKAKIEKQDGVIAGLFELIEKLVEEPTATPATLSGNKKMQFERSNNKATRLNGIAAAMKEIKVLS